MNLEDIVEATLKVAGILQTNAYRDSDPAGDRSLAYEYWHGYTCALRDVLNCLQNSDEFEGVGASLLNVDVIEKKCL